MHGKRPDGVTNPLPFNRETDGRKWCGGCCEGQERRDKSDFKRHNYHAMDQVPVNYADWDNIARGTAHFVILADAPAAARIGPLSPSRRLTHALPALDETNNMFSMPGAKNSRLTLWRRYDRAIWC